MAALWPTQVAALYGLDPTLSAADQTIGIIAGEGGFLPGDVSAAASATGRPSPLVTSVSVDGVDNLFGGGTDADAELALDLQVAAVLAPQARIVVYFAPATQDGMARARPAWQSDVSLPASWKDGLRRRSVPDVAAAAATIPGYRIILAGAEVAKAGTSAATPFWAALLALANTIRGRPLGFVNPRLYALRYLLREVLNGDNRVDGVGFDAGAVWNGCCGLGTPGDASALVRALATAP